MGDGRGARKGAPPSMAPPQPPQERAKWVDVALNLLPHGKLSVAAVKVQVLHAAQRDGANITSVSWANLLAGCDERGIDVKRLLGLQEALGIDMATM